MKLMVYLVALSLSLLPFAGCETLSDTPSENGNRIVHAIDTNGKQIPEDAERILLIDRPSWLSDKPIPYR